MLAAALAAFALLYCPQAVLPALGATFGVGAAVASLAIGATTGALALAVVPISSIAESFGRGKVMRLALLSACLLALASTYAGGFVVMVLLRVVVGVAVAGVVAVGMGHLGDQVDPRVVGSAIGLYVSGSTVGGVLGRLIPGLTQDALGWRHAVAASIGVSTLFALAFAILLPAPRHDTRAPFVLRSHVAVMREHLRDPVIARMCAVATLCMGGFVATYSFLTYRLDQAPFDLSPAVVSLLFLAYLAGTVSSGAAGRLADRVGPRAVLCGSILLALLGIVLTLPDRTLPIAIGLVLFTGGFFGAHAAASGWVAAHARTGKAQASALYLMGYYLGSSVGGTAIGVAWAAGGWPVTAACIGALFLLAGVVALTAPVAA